MEPKVFALGCSSKDSLVSLGSGVELNKIRLDQHTLTNSVIRKRVNKQVLFLAISDHKSSPPTTDCEPLSRLCRRQCH